MAVLLAAWAVRMPPALGGHLHPDEALYAFWGRLIGGGHDVWLARVPVYKPPLLPYLVAGAQLAFGDSEFTLRIPGLAAGLLTVALTAAFARAQYRDTWLAGPAAVVVALSPFAILFSVTVFPDPLMAAIGLGAAVAAARRRAALAGLLAGLAFAVKQSGLAWAPLALVLLLIRRSDRWGGTVRFLVCFAAPVGLVFTWDAIRALQGARSFWDAGISGYGGLRLVWPHEMVTRLCGWARLARYLVASPALNGLLVGGLPALGWVALRNGRLTRAGLTDLSLIGFTTAFVLLHWLLAFPVWDRYLLPLVPVLAVFISRIARLTHCWTSRLARRARAGREEAHWLRNLQPALGRSQAVVCTVLTLLLASPAVGAAQGLPPVGGDHGASEGIDQVALYVSELPEGSVVYHRWQGWHYRYYLFDAPIFLAFWPDPSWLAHDVRAFGSGEPRFVAFPAAESTARVEEALAGVGYRLLEVLTTRTGAGADTFSLYRIIPSGGL